MKRVIAIDLGASNGRLILVKFFKKRLKLIEIHRFPNKPIKIGEHLFWDIPFIMKEIKEGLKKYVHQYGSSLDGIGIDTWGVDFGFISEEGHLIENPHCYRDTHTYPIMDQVHQKILAKDLFERTGVEPAPINTIYQLAAIFNKRPGLFEKASHIVTMPSLVGFLLTGEIYNEFTHASTTQLLKLDTQNWDQDLIQKVFSRKLPMANLQETNTIAGYITSEWMKETGLTQTPIINVPGHDTACALAAMPVNNDTIFMSCGTWVLIGVEVPKPIVTQEAYDWGFTNEGTVQRTYRLQKNNMGFWLLQQCKREWAEMGESISYTEENDLINETQPFQSFIDPDHEMFFNPTSMIRAIQSFCKQTNQHIPHTKGEFIRCIIESLALKYRRITEQIEHLTNKQLRSIHMAGGAIQNKWLCQFTANSTNKSVQAGPIEASSIGNALSQLIALGVCNSIDEAREIVRNSITTHQYDPNDFQEWNVAYQRFIKYL